MATNTALHAGSSEQSLQLSVGAAVMPAALGYHLPCLQEVIACQHGGHDSLLFRWGQWHVARALTARSDKDMTTAVAVT